jgi:hypothetical protein
MFYKLVEMDCRDCILLLLFQFVLGDHGLKICYVLETRLSSYDSMNTLLYSRALFLKRLNLLSVNRCLYVIVNLVSQRLKLLFDYISESKRRLTCEKLLCYCHPMLIPFLYTTRRPGLMSPLCTL